MHSPLLTSECADSAAMTRNSRSTACADASTLPGGFLRSTYLWQPAYGVKRSAHDTIALTGSSLPCSVVDWNRMAVSSC